MQSPRSLQVQLVRIEHSAALPIRRAIFDGRVHTVVPAVLAVEGVLNGALVTIDELGKYVEAWNGRPIPIAHPQQDGQYISANFPDVLERKAGTIFGARVDGDALRAEFWLDEQRMDELGASELLGSMREGKVVEVSTGYFADNLVESGTVDGKPYTIRHVNIRPDHVALLPNDKGACSIADGCGVPRVNQERKPIATALANLMKAVGLKPNDCNCATEEPPMSQVKTLAAAVIALAATLPETIKVNFDTADLEKMSEQSLTGLAAWIKAIQKNYGTAPEKKPGEEEEAMKAQRAAAAAAAGPALTVAQLKDLVTNTVAEAIGAALKGDAINAAVKRGEIKGRLLANKDCPFTAAELDGMSLEALEKYDKSVRPVDYSGAGGFHAQAGGADVEAPFSGGVLSTIARDNAAKKQ